MLQASLVGRCRFVFPAGLVPRTHTLCQTRTLGVGAGRRTAQRGAWTLSNSSASMSGQYPMHVVCYHYPCTDGVSGTLDRTEAFFAWEMQIRSHVTWLVEVRYLITLPFGLPKDTPCGLPRVQRVHASCKTAHTARAYTHTCMARCGIRISIRMGALLLHTSPCAQALDCRHPSMPLRTRSTNHV